MAPVEPNLKKLFFDLDGTLLDVSARNYKVYSELVCEFGGTPLQKPAYWDLKRKKTKWPVLLPESGLSADIEKDFLSRFIPLIERPDYLKLDVLFPGSLTALEVVSPHFDCYLVSLRRNEDNLLQELEWLGIRRYFKKVLSGHSESDGYDKKIELIQHELDSQSGFIVGDTEADIITGKELDLVTIAILSGIRDEQFLEALHPDYMLRDISELPGVLFA